MGIDHRHVGYTLPKFTLTIAPERLAAFAEAIGEVATGQAMAPPTFLKVIEGEGGSSRRILDELGVDLRRVLHAEQQFEYFAPLRVGDVVTVERKVAEIYEKKGGEMEFIVIETGFFDAAGERRALSRQIVLVRHPKKREQ
ncbi:MAG: MaoC family dehydratase N-terminal domain-containing protein [Proteobacteria bacterium]|nr:MaoC family dehydratase N-terminal domain-containing protein [Pseudomonadota bacterium]